MKSDVVVYTGVFGRLALPDSSGVVRELFLFEDSKGDPFIHVPLYYWKVVHDPAKAAAVAFVGYNNPHITQPPEEGPLCQDK